MLDPEDNLKLALAEIAEGKAWRKYRFALILLVAGYAFLAASMVEAVLTIHRDAAVLGLLGMGMASVWSGIALVETADRRRAYRKAKAETTTLRQAINRSLLFAEIEREEREDGELT
jgi:hypothetical protein